MQEIEAVNTADCQAKEVEITELQIRAINIRDAIIGARLQVLHQLVQLNQSAIDAGRKTVGRVGEKRAELINSEVEKRALSTSRSCGRAATQPGNGCSQG